MRVAVLLCVSCACAVAQVNIQTHDDQTVSVAINGTPFTTFHFGPDTRKPYLAPLRTANGIVVTRSFPMSTDVAGESRDHPHHRGVWFTHGNVNGYDFWGNEDSQNGAGKGKGVVVVNKLDRVRGGERNGDIHATFHWKTGDGKVLLSEDRTMTFYEDRTLRTIDFDISLTAREKVVFGDTKEGTF
ncbi:MAG: PmoA family protein, partial [Acidobacteriaceae bacterium]|nr:PmoA family protein [Acidobacteriaceae bacterium]